MLDEYAARFYLFLDHALKIHAEEQYALLIATSFPHADNNKRKQIMKRYKKLMSDPVDENATIEKDREELRRLFSKK